MSNNQNIDEKVMSLNFNQSSFIIERVVKNSLKDSNLPKNQPLTLKANKTYDISIAEDNLRFVKMTLGFVGDMVSSEDESLSFRFIEVSALAGFYLENDVVGGSPDEALEKMLLIQANVQLTDFVNTLVLASELRGNKVPYDM